VNCDWGLEIDARSSQRVKAAAEERFRALFPDRHISHSRIWSAEGGYFVVAVFQHAIRPSNSPTFFRVDGETGSAELEADQLRYRPRNLK
jgi:hypothetical protein